MWQFSWTRLTAAFGDNKWCLDYWKVFKTTSSQRSSWPLRRPIVETSNPVGLWTNSTVSPTSTWNDGSYIFQLKTQVCQTFEDLENTWEGGACVDTPHIDKCLDKNWPNIDGKITNMRNRKVGFRLRKRWKGLKLEPARYLMSKGGIFSCSDKSCRWSIINL